MRNGPGLRRLKKKPTIKRTRTIVIVSLEWKSTCLAAGSKKLSLTVLEATESEQVHAGDHLRQSMVSVRKFTEEQGEGLLSSPVANLKLEAPSGQRITAFPALLSLAAVSEQTHFSPSAQ